MYSRWRGCSVFTQRQIQAFQDALIQFFPTMQVSVQNTEWDTPFPSEGDYQELGEDSPGTHVLLKWYDNTYQVMRVEHDPGCWFRSNGDPGDPPNTEYHAVAGPVTQFQDAIEQFILAEVKEQLSLYFSHLEEQHYETIVSERGAQI